MDRPLYLNQYLKDLNNLIKRPQLGTANGVATLDQYGKVPAQQLPSYVDDIIDVYATYSKSDTGILSNIILYLDEAHTQLVIGEKGKIYQNVADGEFQYQFRWTGTIFSQTGASSLILGEITGTAYDGAKGKANTDNIAKIKGTSLSHIKDTNNVTTAANKVSINYECYSGEQYGATGTAHTVDLPAATTAKAGVMSAADKTKLDNVAKGAEVNVQSDWDVIDAASDAFIKNKPTSMPASDVSAWAKAATKPTYTKTEVGLGNVDNTSDANKPVSTAQATAIADAKKAGTNAQTAVTAEVTRAKAAEETIQTALNNHKADKDKKHIPAGGHERQILAWDEDGKAKWDDLANMFTGLEELLAYGVEWEDDVQDPHLTRIGNMSLHKTLPIQSQLKGCIAQQDKVIYWLDEKDWRFRKDPIYKKAYVPDTDPNYISFMDPTELADLAIGQFVRTGTHIGKIVQFFNNDSVIHVEWEEDLGDILTELTNITKLEIGSRLDGYDGTVRVYCPNFYIKSQIIGNTRRVWLSTVKIDNTWTYQHEILIDAYRSTVLNTVPENMGYLSTFPVNSAISVVNTATYCRGGDNRDNYDKYLTGAGDTTVDIFRTDLGKPRTNPPGSVMRTYARNAGSETLSYDQYKNIFYWLYVVEYANFNCQEAYNAELTEDGYRQGGLGNGITNVSNWGDFNDYYPITPCGYGNDLGNGTGVKLITSPGLTPANGVYMCRWRGFDNPFGDIFTILDGIIIDADANNHPNNMNYVYTCQDPDKYADNLDGEGYKKVGEEVHQDGYTKLFDLGDAAHIIPHVMGGDTTKFKCDYHWVGNKDTTLRTLFVGGSAEYGAYSGLGAFGSDFGVSDSFSPFGFRSVSRFVSFPGSED